ncbi:MAG: hypothetical protein KC620_16015, partial [Myxococcales bacterium]|nr:hypothetical protein [Myxococcales bacterium]
MRAIEGQPTQRRVGRIVEERVVGRHVELLVRRAQGMMLATDSQADRLLRAVLERHRPAGLPDREVQAHVAFGGAVGRI